MKQKAIHFIFFSLCLTLISCSARYKLSGSVVNSSLEPVVEANIIFTHINQKDSISGKSDRNGNFYLNKIPFKKGKLFIYAKYYEPFVKEIVFDQKEKLENVQLLFQATSIKGTVLSLTDKKPIANAKVFPVISPYHSAYTDKNGNFELKEGLLPDSPNEIQIIKNGYQPATLTTELEKNVIKNIGKVYLNVVDARQALIHDSLITNVNQGPNMIVYGNPNQVEIERFLKTHKKFTLTEILEFVKAITPDITKEAIETNLNEYIKKKDVKIINLNKQIYESLIYESTLDY